MAARRDEDGSAEAAHRFEVEGNRLHLLIEGEERLEALLALIDSAERDLRLLYYIFSDDTVGTKVRDALTAARQRGVKVSLLVDGFGSEKATDAFFAPLRAAGGSVCRFLPRFGRRYLLRNHQKIAIADRDRAMIGGFNIDESYFAPPEQQGWRDLGLRIDGPVATHLIGYFDALLRWARNDKATIRRLNRTLARYSQREGALRWLFGGPSKRPSAWVRALRGDIGRGRRLDVIAAYFAPNPGMIRRLGRLAQRGALRILTAAKSDNSMTVAAARNTYVRLLKRTAQVWEYQLTRLHTKLYVIDDVSYIGSANLDMRSLYINCEIMLRIEDAALADTLRGYFDGEIGEGQEASLDLIRKRAWWWTRIKWKLAYFLVAVVDYTVTRRMNFGRIGKEIG